MLHIHRARPPIALIALASFVIFLLALLVGGDVLARRSAEAHAPETSKLEAAPTRPELPREWQWKRTPVRFDGMYRAM